MKSASTAWSLWTKRKVRVGTRQDKHWEVGSLLWEEGRCGRHTTPRQPPAAALFCGCLLQYCSTSAPVASPLAEVQHVTAPATQPAELSASTASCCAVLSLLNPHVFCFPSHL